MYSPTKGHPADTLKQWWRRYCVKTTSFWRKLRQNDVVLTLKRRYHYVMCLDDDNFKIIYRIKTTDCLLRISIQYYCMRSWWWVNIDLKNGLVSYMTLNDVDRGMEAFIISLALCLSDRLPPQRASSFELYFLNSLNKLLNKQSNWWWFETPRRSCNIHGTLNAVILWYFRRWLYRKLSFWQLPVQPATKMSSKWRHILYSAIIMLWESPVTDLYSVDELISLQYLFHDLLIQPQEVHMEPSLRVVTVPRERYLDIVGPWHHQRRLLLPCGVAWRRSYGRDIVVLRWRIRGEHLAPTRYQAG